MQQQKHILFFCGGVATASALISAGLPDWGLHALGILCSIVVFAMFISLKQQGEL